MSCVVQTCSRSASNPNCATASRDFAMNGTSTPAPGLVTSSRQHSTASSRPTSRRRTDSPSPAGDTPARGRLGRRARRPRCRRARGRPARHPDPRHRQPGRLLDGCDHRGRLPQPAAHRRPRLRPAVGLYAMLDTLSATQELTAGSIDRDQAEVIANAMRRLAEQGDQRHGRPVQGRTRRGPHRAADGTAGIGAGAFPRITATAPGERRRPQHRPHDPAIARAVRALAVAALCAATATLHRPADGVLARVRGADRPRQRAGLHQVRATGQVAQRQPRRHGQELQRRLAPAGVRAVLAGERQEVAMIALDVAYREFADSLADVEACAPRVGGSPSASMTSRSMSLVSCSSPRAAEPNNGDLDRTAGDRASG